MEDLGLALPQIVDVDVGLGDVMEFIARSVKCRPSV